MKENKGITLIVLVVTIIILLILAGTVINLTVSENGLMKQAQKAGQEYSQQQARERLEIVLLDMQAAKAYDKEYNQNDYLTQKIQKEGMTVNGDIVIVESWSFQIDRSIPKIVAVLGKGEENNEIQIQMASQIDTNTNQIILRIEIQYTEEIRSINLQGEELAIPVKTDGKYIVEKEITQNGTYTVIVTDQDGKYKIETIDIVQIEEDLDIYTKEQFTSFANSVNSGKAFQGKTIRLMNSIDLQGSNDNQCQPIQNFKGTFDGQNNTVSGIYINNSLEKQGLFGSMEAGNVQNLVASGTIIAQNNNVGGICGYLGNGGEIKNCINKINVIGKESVGGIAGYSSGKVTMCSNEANIEGTGKVGGIVGYLQITNLENCFNKGNILINGPWGGGIVGFADAMVNACYNRGNVTSTGQDSNGMADTGGIVGFTLKGGEYCYNIGTITATKEYGAGIQGYSNYASMNHIINLGIVQNNNHVTATDDLKWYISNPGWARVATYNQTLSPVPANYLHIENSENFKGENAKQYIIDYLGGENQYFVTDINNKNDGYPLLKWQQ